MTATITTLTNFLLGLVLIMAKPGDSLTIYRLGGEGLPVPEAANEEGVDFVQLFWADVDDDLFGSSHQLETTGVLTPVRLDPSVNLTPLIRERGGRIQLNNSYGWQTSPTSISCSMETTTPPIKGCVGISRGAST